MFLFSLSTQQALNRPRDPEILVLKHHLSFLSFLSFEPFGVPNEWIPPDGLRWASLPVGPWRPWCAMRLRGSSAAALCGEAEADVPLDKAFLFEQHIEQHGRSWCLTQK